MKIHCSGIGGIGLSAYAALQKLAGHDVSGSDRSESALTRSLAAQGIAVSTDQSGEAIPPGCELLVYSEAIPASAPERMRAKERGIPQESYPQALGKLSKGHRTIAVCGTHGKSSTTAMAARLLISSGLDPSVVVGTKVRELDGRNWRKGAGDLFLLEACEYRRSFRHYDPSIILLTTCDGDHFDYFSSPEDYRDAFVEFVAKLPPDGALMTHLSDPACASIAATCRARVMDADSYPLLPLGTPGLHMQQNAQLVLALGDLLQIDSGAARDIVSGYSGCWRRIEERGTTDSGVTVIDDYGHHPREIRATIQAVAAAHPRRRLVCVFQPHTHDRTLKLYDDFLTSFKGVDVLVIPNVYDARSDTESKAVDVATFVKDIAAASHVQAIDGHSLADTEHMLRSDILRDRDVLLCMGAGDITNLATTMAAR